MCVKIIASINKTISCRKKIKIKVLIESIDGVQNVHNHVK